MITQNSHAIAQAPIDDAAVASYNRTGEAASTVRYALDLPIERQ